MAIKTNQKILGLIAILLLPSFIYLLLSSGDFNYSSLPYIGPRSTQTKMVDGKEIVDTVYHKIPAFNFTDHNGHSITQEDIQGKIVVANFFFSRCPSICPKMASHLLEIQRHYEDREDFMIISHSVDPEYDNVQILEQYAKKVHGNNKTWHFLTGEKEDIYDVAFNGYFANAMEDEVAPGGFLHSEMLFLLDRNGHIRGSIDKYDNIVPAFDGTSTHEVKNLIDAIDNLYREDFVPLKK